MSNSNKFWKKDDKTDSSTDNKTDSSETDKTQRKKMTISIVALIVSALSVMIAIVSTIFTVVTNTETRNYDSYFESLNFTLEVRSPRNDYRQKNTILFEGATPFTSQQIILSPYSGAIKAASIIYYYNNKTYSVRQLELMSEVDREKNNASDISTAIIDFTQYAYEKSACSKKYKDQGFSESYYTNLYLAVEDFYEDVELRLLVFEYPIGKDGNITGEYDSREYSEIFQLVSTDTNDEDIPAFDKKQMDDFRNLTEVVDAIFE